MLPDFFELIEHQLYANLVTITFIKTVLRGLVMLLSLPELENFDSFSLFEKNVRLFKILSEELKKQPKSKDQEFIVSLLSKSVPKREFQQMVQRFQNYVTLVII